MHEPLLLTPTGNTVLEESDDFTESVPDSKDDSVVLTQPATDAPVTSLTPPTVPQTIEGSLVQDAQNPPLGEG